MATKKEIKKQRKQKKRSAEKKKKILSNRASIRLEAKSKREDFRREKQIKRIQKNMESFEHYPEEFLDTLPQETLDRIEHNAQILRTIEQEHEYADSKRQQLNEILEGEGAATLEEKMNIIAKRAMENGEEAICMNSEEEKE